MAFDSVSYRCKKKQARTFGLERIRHELTLFSGNPKSICVLRPYHGYADRLPPHFGAPMYRHRSPKQDGGYYHVPDSIYLYLSGIRFVGKEMESWWKCALRQRQRRRMRSMQRTGKLNRGTIFHDMISIWTLVGDGILYLGKKHGVPNRE